LAVTITLLFTLGLSYVLWNAYQGYQAGQSYSTPSSTSQTSDRAQAKTIWGPFPEENKGCSITLEFWENDVREGRITLMDWDTAYRLGQENFTRAGEGLCFVSSESMPPEKLEYWNSLIPKN